MDRADLQRPPRRDHRPRHRKARNNGLRIVERDGYWHIHGTLRVKGCSVRVRRSSELPARAELWEDADAIRRKVEDEIRGEVIHGIRPTRPVAVAAREYLELDDDGNPKPGGRGDRMAHKDFGIIQEVVRKFGFRLLTEIPSKEWRDWLDARHLDNLQDSRQRHVNIIRPFLKWCAHEDRRYLPAVPVLVDPGAAREKIKRQAPRPRRRVAELRPDLLVFVFSHAHISLRAQLYTEWSTGARVSSVIFGCALGDLVLTDARCQVTFHNTKNGDDVVAKLHPAAVEVLQEYLGWRGRLHLRKEPLFLTHHRRPYSEKAWQKGASGFNKTGFNAMKRRAIRALLRASVQARRAGDRALADQLRADARLIRQFTQHWLRHWFATYGRAMQIPRSFIKAQAGWRDDRSIERYEQDVEEMRRNMVDSMPIGGPAAKVGQ